MEKHSKKIEIPMRLPSLNEYIAASKIQRGRYNAGNDMKQKVQYDIIPYLEELGTFSNGVKVEFTWIEPDKKRDLDNVCFAKKFILDAMVKAGIIPNDNSRYVKGFRDNFGYAKGEPKVIVEVIEDE